MGTWYTNENLFLESIKDTQIDTFDDLSYDIYGSPISRLSSYLFIESSINILVTEIDSELTLSSNDDSIIIANSHLTNCIGGIFSLHNGSNKVSGICNVYSIDKFDNVLSSYSINLESVDTFFIGYSTDEVHIGLRLEPEDTNLFAGITQIYIGNFVQTINPTPLESLEDVNSQLYLYSDYIIDSSSVETQENIVIENIFSQSEIFPNSITSQETFKKPLIWPTPYPGQIYFWYEQIHSIDFELNVRSKS